MRIHLLNIRNTIMSSTRMVSGWSNRQNWNLHFKTQKEKYDMGWLSRENISFLDNYSFFC